jgi:hypothetical protein
MWFLGKRESVNAWKKADFDGFREKDEMEQMQGISWTIGTNSRKCYASKLALKWQRFCLIGKPSMFFPSFLNRFSYFMNL